jgi:TP901 family phage tail tape measure protein
MTENFGVRAEFDIGTAKAIKSLNEMISVFARIEEQTQGVNNAVAKMAAQAQRDAVKVVQSFKQTETAAQAQSSAIRGLVAQYNALQRAQAAGASRQRGPLASVGALGAQQGRELQAQAAATVRFNDYVRQSNARVQAAEAAALRRQTAIVRSEYAAQNNVRRQSSEAQVRYAAEAARANAQYGDSLSNLQGSLAGTRYALYDVATTYAAVSAATLGASAAAVKVAIDYEQAFASVARTTEATGAQLQDLQEDLLKISTTMPVAFGDVTAIATLGAQLGVATENIDDFTTTVAQFSATTNVTTDAAATGIGRLVQLTNKSKGSFDQYASAIYQVGINSVATEAEILNVAQQIAVSGNLAGFTADQIIGLAGALSSLGVRPEAARGSILRIFNEITKAADMGGDSLNQFSSIAGMSADDFVSAWKSDPQQVFSAFIEGLDRSADSGGNLVAMLSDLGIKAVRDQRALQLLADNTSVYNQALADSATAYKDGTALAEGYAITADTIAARLKVLAQTLLAVANAGGSSLFGVLRPAIEALQGIAEAAERFINTPVGKAIAGVTLAVSAGVGIFFALRAAVTLAEASLLAMLQVQSQLAARTGVTTMSMRTLTTTLFQVAVGGNTAAGGLAAATAAARAFGSATLVGAGIVGALFAVNKIVEMVSYSLSSGTEKAEAYFGNLSELGDALKADTATYKETGEAIRTISIETESSSTRLAGWALDLQSAAGSQVTLNDGTEKTTTAVRNQTVAIGDNAKAWLANKIANDTAFQGIFQNNQQLLSQIGFNLKDYLNSVLEGEGGGAAYLDELSAAIERSRQASIAAVDSSDIYGHELAEIESSANQAQTAIAQLEKVTAASDGAFSSAAAQAQFTKDVQEALGVTIDNSAGAMDEFGDSVSGVDQKLSELVDSEYAVIGGTIEMQNAMFALGQSLYENGNSFDVFSVGGRENMIALQAVVSAMAAASGGDATVLANNIAGLMQSLQSFGVSAANDLIYLQNILNGLTGGKGTAGLKAITPAANQAGNALGQGFSAGANKAAKSAKKATKAAKETKKEIVTLSDYVDDLGNVFSKAFDIRFGLDQALDSVSEGWAKMASYAEEAAEEVRDAVQEIIEADAKIQGLNAANQTLQYQLTVAQEYGDVLRANEILAEMADNNAELSDVQTDRLRSERALTRAQQAAQPILDGSTEASREQRDMVLSLLGSYQKQVQELANTGLSQQELSRRTQELRAQFVQQMIQMGYSRAEVERYAQSFDDLAFSINNVPRNITVGADVGPAQRALNEFLARANNSSANATLTASGGGGAYEASGINVGGGGINSPFLNSNDIIANTVSTRNPTGGPRMLIQSKGGVVPEYRASGGVHGLHPGGPVGTDTVPAWLTPGEFTQQKAAVDYYGLPFMNALNNMQIPRYFSSGGSAGAVRSTASSSGPMIVEIMPHQVQQIIRGVSQQIVLDGKIVAETTNSHNANNARRGSN